MASKNSRRPVGKGSARRFSDFSRNGGGYRPGVVRAESPEQGIGGGARNVNPPSARDFADFSGNGGKSKSR